MKIATYFIVIYIAYLAFKTLKRSKKLKSDPGFMKLAGEAELFLEEISEYKEDEDDDPDKKEITTEILRELELKYEKTFTEINSNVSYRNSNNDKVNEFIQIYKNISTLLTGLDEEEN